MKKVVLYIFLAIFILGSCKKEKTSNSENIENNINTFKEDGGIQGKRVLYWERYVSPDGSIVVWYVGGCKLPALSCLDDVVVTAPADKSSNDYRFQIYTQFLESFNNNEISDFFSNSDYGALFPELLEYPQIVNEIIQNKLKLYHEIGLDDKHYYIALPDKYRIWPRKSWI